VRWVAQTLLSHARPSVLNQALMELGALVCTPRSPRCDVCPWAASCAGRATGVPEVFPRRPPRRATLDVACYAAVVRDGDRLLFRRRPEGLHNAGLWELPTTDWHPGKPSPVEGRQSLTLLGEGLSARWLVGEPVTRARHSITHHRVTVVAHEVSGRVPARADLTWATPQEAAQLGTTAGAGKLLRGLPTLL
jgi:A/G-specific adenine glycosylase